ncbi:hypothetical protein MLD38_040229 [Melastoma candidum]|nr:hypothetical protein MLD38_040229 [Melastoma candidum]
MHVLPRLDGPALASASSSTSYLRSLSSDDDLWRSIAESTWPSIAHPLVSQVVSSFPSGHRSFFSDAYPLLDGRLTLPSKSISEPSTLSLISAVDVFYKGEPILSRVQEMETVSRWFTSSPFRVDLLDEKESVPTPIRGSPSEKAGGDDLDGWLSHIEENLTLSWILVDPVAKRAANMSSLRPVTVHRHWLTGEVQARYETVLLGRGAEAVCVTGEVRLRPLEGDKEGAVEASEVSLRAEDVEGKCLSGRESLGAIAGTMTEGKRRKGRGKVEGKMRYEEYEAMKRKCRERKQRKERVLDLACISLGVTLFLAFWSFLLFR